MWVDFGYGMTTLIIISYVIARNTATELLRMRSGGARRCTSVTMSIQGRRIAVLYARKGSGDSGRGGGGSSKQKLAALCILSDNGTDRMIGKEP